MGGQREHNKGPVIAGADSDGLSIDTVRHILWDWDLVTNVIRWSEEGPAAATYGVPEGPLPPSWWEERIHPDDRQRVMEQLGAAVATGERFSATYRLRRANGSWAQVYAQAVVIPGLAGEAVRMVGSLQDHSDRHEAIAALRERESQLATIFGQAMIGIMHLSPDGRVLMVNNRMCEILGRSEGQVRSERFTDWTHPDDLKSNLRLLAKQAKAAEPCMIEKRYVHPDGTMVWCSVHLSFVGSAGAVTGIIVVAEDITARREAEIELARQKALLQNVVDSVSDLIFVKAADGKFILTNRALEENCGLLTGRRTSDAFAQDLVRGLEVVDAEVISSGQPREVEEVIPVKGSPRLFDTVLVPWVKDGAPAGVIGVSRDITDRKAAESALRESELLYRSVLQASADCIKIISLDGRIELMNEPGLCTMEIAVPEDIVGAEWAALWPDGGREAATQAVARASAGHVARFTGFCPTAKGTPKWWDVVVSPMNDEDGRIVRLLAISRDITLSRQTAEKLRWTSEHDGLTELPNRKTFQARLQGATIRAMESGEMVGLLLMDLDHFKHVNDTLGHSAGDHLLTIFAKRLTSSVRARDFVARLGGDEFAVILEGVKEEEDLIRAGQSILARLQAPISVDGRAISAGASIGGALFPRDASTAQELFNNADMALYSLKAAGRGGTKMFHNHMRQHAQNVASQLSLARVALSEESVIPNYQPKIDLRTGEVAGFEALLRWRHPRFGIQLPETVAEAFKDYELASRIGDLMQRKVVRDLRRWEDRGFVPGPVSINAAPAEFLRDDYAERLLKIIANAGVSPRALEVEVTEHVFFDRASEFVARALKALHEAGVRIALDDFGTGYSSLSHLRDFPVDVVKIDHSFISKMIEEPEIGAIVSAVIDLARSLGIDVVGEGVETEQQRDVLASKGCSFGQGYLFGRAAEADEVQLLLRRVQAAA
ncbi:EAL domain-containing protein [Sphingomonas sp.]|uniref:EAL domain-containing protein n=1 Tax=Sphingomonas sp. TaxID=28214 RepID=UPI002FC958D6